MVWSVMMREWVFSPRRTLAIARAALVAVSLVLARAPTVDAGMRGVPPIMGLVVRPQRVAMSADGRFNSVRFLLRNTRETPMRVDVANDWNFQCSGYCEARPPTSHADRLTPNVGSTARASTIELPARGAVLVTAYFPRDHRRPADGEWIFTAGITEQTATSSPRSSSVYFEFSAPRRAAR